MLTWCSDSTRVTSDSNPPLSKASICICTKNKVFEVGAQLTSIRRSGSSISCSTFLQSFLWTDTPEPRVTKPINGSPGTGVQQRASLTSTSPSPFTKTPASFERVLPDVLGVGSWNSCSSFSSWFTAAVSFSTTDCADTWLVPTAA